MGEVVKGHRLTGGDGHTVVTVGGGQRSAVVRSHAGLDRDGGRAGAAHLGHGEVKRPVVGHRGPFGESQHHGGVLRPGGEDVVYGVGDRDHVPNLVQRSIVHGEVVIANARTVVVDGEREVQALPGRQHGVLRVDGQQDRLGGRDRGDQRRGRRQEEKKHTCDGACAGGHGTTSRPFFKRFRSRRTLQAALRSSASTASSSTSQGNVPSTGVRPKCPPAAVGR